MGINLRLSVGPRRANPAKRHSGRPLRLDPREGKNRVLPTEREGLGEGPAGTHGLGLEAPMLGGEDLACN